MAEDLNKKILIQVEAETDQFKKNITDLNQTLDSLLQKQKQLSDSGQQSAKAFNRVGNGMNYEFAQAFKNTGYLFYNYTYG